MTFLAQLKKRRSEWVRANRENNFEEGILNLLTELYPDNAHFIYELLQNAEDAQATKVEFKLEADRLVFRHNGQIQFAEQNVESITSIGKSTKRDDVNQIGKFGVGFKAVFSYTTAPRVFSGPYAFEILDLVCPSEITPGPNAGTETVFELPFNKPNKPRDVANAEVLRGLEELSETTLLFLNNIEKICWQAGAEKRVDITRLAVSDVQCEIEYLRNGVERRVKEWLLLKDYVRGKPQLHVGIAFALEALDRPASTVATGLLGQQYRIQRCNGQVCIYFPADKEASKLRFHLHAPFASTVARDSVRDRPENNALMEQLAVLLARSLHLIRDQGLLTQDFLEVLPLLDDDISTFYGPLLQAVLQEMTAAALTPTHAKGFAPASTLMQGSATLKDLLNDQDLNVLTSREGVAKIAWATNALQNSRAEKFLRSLEIPVVSGDALVRFIARSARPQVTARVYDKVTNRLTQVYSDRPGVSPEEIQRSFWAWLDQHDDHWMQRMYATLHELAPQHIPLLSMLRMAPIVRVFDGRYLAGESTYFPAAGVEDDAVFARVRTAVYSSGRSDRQKQEATAFLAKLGVREVGPQEDIERILRARYSGDAAFPAFAPHLRDMKAFIEFWEAHPKSVAVFEGKSIFLSDDESHFCDASRVYLDAPFLDTGLSGLYRREGSGSEPERWGLIERYLTDKKFAKRLVEFATALGVQRGLDIREVSTDGHPQWSELQADLLNGAHKRDTGIDTDYVIDDLAKLLSPSQVRLNTSRAVWMTMVHADAEVLEATFKANRQQSLRTRPSRLVLALRSLAWVPLADGRFVTPSHATQKTLASVLPFDNTNGWLTAVGVGEAEQKETTLYRKKEQQVITDGFASLEEYDLVRSTLQNIPAEQRQQALEMLRERFMVPPARRPFPGGPVRNRDLRKDRVAEEVEQTLPKERNLVSRTVTVGYQETKGDSREYLRQQYTDDHGVMLCQLCRDELPFKALDGRYFFEATAVLDDVPKLLRAAYLCLCPNHAAMYQHANPDRARIVRLLEECEGRTVEIELAGRTLTVEFTEAHLLDVQTSLKAALRKNAGVEEAADGARVPE
jgi:hypothetical protein